MISDYFKLATRNLRKRKLRSWLTMLGIFISIATIFTLISLSLGLENAVEEQFQMLGTDKFFIMPGTGFLGAPGIVGGTILTENDVEVIENTRGVVDLSYVVMANAEVEFSNEVKYFMVAGIPLDRLDVFLELESFDAEEGQILEKGDTGKVMLGNDFLNGNIFDKPIRAGNRIEINGKKFDVIGIVERIGNPSDDQMIYLSLEDFRENFDVPTRVDQIIVQVEDETRVVEVSERVEDELRDFRNVDEQTQDFMVSTPEALLESFQNILNIITYFLAGIAGISLLVGAINISNTMYTSVLERTKEIGIMKAIGAKNSDILWIFMIEAGLLGLVGAGIGILLGYLVSKSIELIAINYLGTTLLQVASPLYLILGCLIFGFLIGAVSGTLPAYRASKTNVVDALRYE